MSDEEKIANVESDHKIDLVNKSVGVTGNQEVEFEELGKEELEEKQFDHTEKSVATKKSESLSLGASVGGSHASGYGTDFVIRDELPPPEFLETTKSFKSEIEDDDDEEEEEEEEDEEEQVLEDIKDVIDDMEYEGDEEVLDKIDKIEETSIKIDLWDVPDDPLGSEYPTTYPPEIQPSEELEPDQIEHLRISYSDKADIHFAGELSASEEAVEFIAKQPLIRMKWMEKEKELMDMQLQKEEKMMEEKVQFDEHMKELDSKRKIIEEMEELSRSKSESTLRSRFTEKSKRSSKISKVSTKIPLEKKKLLKPEDPAEYDEPLLPSPTESEQIEAITLPGPSSFLDFEQPPDETDKYTLPDTIDTNIEVACPVMMPGNVFEEDEDKMVHKNALSLIKSFGQESKIPVLNLSQGEHLALLYACSHTGVVYDVENKQQYILQGHSNAVSCLATSFDKTWAVVADKGERSVLNVWHISVHTKQMIPIRTIFKFQSDGVSAVAMSYSGNLLAVMTAGAVQTLSVWNWTDPVEVPLVKVNIDSKYGAQNFLLFNPDDPSQLVSNSDRQVIFYAWNENHIKPYAPQIVHVDVAKQVGKFISTVFFKNSSNALTATSAGKFLVWEKFRPLMVDSVTPYKRVHKIVRMQNRGITVLTTVNKYVVTGDGIGHIKFYDETLKLVNWFKDVNIGPISSISFDFDSEVKNDTELLAYGKETAFQIPNFIFGTSNSKFVYVTANGTKYDIIIEDFECQVMAMDVHPSKPLIALGGMNGIVRIVQYHTGNAVASKVFDGGKVGVTCLSFNIDGSMIAVGFANGKVEVLHGLNLQRFCKHSLTDTSEAITHISFAPNLDYMATADKGFAVTMYRIQKEKIWIDDGNNFIYFGRYRAHNKPIRTIMFKCSARLNLVEFYSLGLDRYLVEYHLYSPIGIGVKSRKRLEQFGVPLCMNPYPKFSKEEFLLICNDQFKFKLINTTTCICRKTILGPTYGIPVQKFLTSSCKGKGNNQTYFIAYMLADKIGISLLPMTGNPHQSFTMISHPSGVQNIAISYDGKYLFSVGGKSASLLMWHVNLMALEVQVDLGGSNLAPFYEQIEGGKDGPFMYELQNLFYYAQIQNQGISTSEERHVGSTIPLSEISSILRVLGYFPTEQEISEMTNEIKYEKFIESGELVEAIDVESFLRLYVNHKPVTCQQERMIDWAFDTLGTPSKTGEKGVADNVFLKYLTEIGEPLTQAELAECLATISDANIESSVCLPSLTNVDVENFLPEIITATEFRKILGFDNL